MNLVKLIFKINSLGVLVECLGYRRLVASEKIAGIYFIFYIIKTGIVSISNDCLAHFFKFLKVIYDLAGDRVNGIIKIPTFIGENTPLCYA